MKQILLFGSRQIEIYELNESKKITNFDFDKNYRDDL